MKCWVAVALFATASVCCATEQVVSIATRPGITLSYLLVHDTSVAPKVVVISFVGGLGAIGLVKRAEKGPVKFGPTANFLVRVREALVNADFADAIVDSPSDRLPDGMTDDFRLEAEHAADIRIVITDLKRQFPSARIFLVGTSRGTISAAALGARMGDAIQGVVLTSTVTNADKGGPALSRFDFDSLKVPVLVVHHRDDGCFTSPYTGAERLGRRFPLVSVRGGDAPQTGPCDPLAPHGYFGREAPVVQAMKDWMLGRDFARDINY